MIIKYKYINIHMIINIHNKHINNIQKININISNQQNKVSVFS